MPDDGVRFSAALETVDLDVFPAIVEEDFALHVAVENGVLTFDDVGVKIFTAFHIIIAVAAV